jgi:hypothetical protein
MMDYDYREVEINEKFLKIKTTLFMIPDFILARIQQNGKFKDK